MSKLFCVIIKNDSDFLKSCEIDSKWCMCDVIVFVPVVATTMHAFSVAWIVSASTWSVAAAMSTFTDTIRAIAATMWATMSLLRCCYSLV